MDILKWFVATSFVILAFWAFREVQGGGNAFYAFLIIASLGMAYILLNGWDVMTEQIWLATLLSFLASAALSYYVAPFALSYVDTIFPSFFRDWFVIHLVLDTPLMIWAMKKFSD